MERITQRDEFGNADIIGIDSMGLQCNLEFDEFNKVTNALNKLAEYEDLEEKGLLRRLSCAVGDTLYCDGKYFASHCEGELHSFKVSDIVTEIRSYFRGEVDYCFNSEDVGKNAFLTQDAAEAALKEL